MTFPAFVVVLALHAQTDDPLPPAAVPAPADQPATTEPAPPAPAPPPPAPSAPAAEPAPVPVPPVAAPGAAPEEPPPAPAPEKKKRRRVRPPRAPESARDLDGQPAPARSRADVAGAAAGAVVPVLLWLPALALCCGGGALLALVWPVSLGDPTLSSANGPTRAWTTLCYLGCPMGVLGWVLALPTALVSGVLTGLTGGTLGVAVGALRRVGVLSLVASGALALTAGVLASGVSLVLVGAVGALSMAGLAFLYVSTASQQTPSPGMRWWWLGLNTALVGALVATLGAVGLGITLPASATVGTYALLRRLTAGLDD